jgi:DNA repair protein RadC
MELYSIKKNPSDLKKEKISSSADACRYIRQFFFEDLEVYESVFLLLLNQQNQTVGYAKISQGGVAGTVVDPKIVAKYIVDNLATGAIMAHNHPSGNLSPSPQDKQITKRVQEVCKLLDSKLLDHLIITSESYFSFCDEGIL